MSETQDHGVLYYNRGAAYVDRLGVSMHSLRKHWGKPATLVQEGVMPAAIEWLCVRYAVCIVHITETGRTTYAGKIAALRHTAYEKTLFLDADTLVVGPLEAYFALGESVDFVFTRFGTMIAGSEHSLVPRRKRSWSGKGLIPEELIEEGKELPAINVGSFLYTKGHPFLEVWATLAWAGAEHLLDIPDEICAQLYLPRLNYTLAGPEWGLSGRMGDVNTKANIIHYHDGTHTKGHRHEHRWQREYQELLGMLESQPEQGNMERLVYFIAFDKDGVYHYRDMAKMAIASLLRTGYDGTIWVFKNRRDRIFQEPRRNVREIPVALDCADDSIALRYTAKTYHVRVREYLKEEAFAEVIYLDVDVLVTRDLGELRDRNTEVALGRVQDENGESYDAGVWAVEGCAFAKLVGEWQSFIAAEGPKDGLVAWDRAFYWNKFLKQYTGTTAFVLDPVDVPGLMGQGFGAQGKIVHFRAHRDQLERKVRVQFGRYMEEFFGDACSMMVNMLEP